MSVTNFLPTMRRLVQMVIVAGLYYLTARLGFLMALPPGNVTALWPPSGLALAAVLVWGWPQGLGIFAGSFVVNFGALSGPAALPVSAAIATGSTLQAWGAAWLIRRCSKTLPPATIRHTLLTLGILTVTTLLAPVTGVTSLCLAGLAPWSDYPMLAWTWWLGDYAGILVFAPALVGLSLRWRKQTVAEPFLWPFTSLIVGLALLAFSLIGAVEANRVVAWMSLLVGLTLAGSFVAYVSSRQQSEAAIARSEAEYRLIADNTADVIWILDAESQQFTYISPSVKKLRDYTPQEALTQSLREVLTPNSLTKAMALWPERLAAFAQDRAAVTHIDELDQVRKDGSIVRTEVSTTFVTNEAGKLQLVGISRDITERQQASEMLRQSQASLEAAQAMARLGSWELDIQRNALHWSDEIYRIFGMPPEEFKATYEAFLDAIHPEDREMVNRAYLNAVQTGEPYEVVHRLLLKDGTLKYVHEKCKTYYDEDGTPLRSVGTVQDITERREMEMEIHERVKEMTCLFQISRLLEDHQASVETLCTHIVESIAPAMQFPQLAAPALILDGKCSTAGCCVENLAHRLQADIVVNGETRGALCVGYTADEPFILPEEQELLDNIARMLGLWLEQREAEIAMRAAQRALEEMNRDLERRVAERTAEVQDLYDNAPTGYHSLDSEGRYLMINQTELKWLGYTHEEMRGRSLREFLTPESQVVFQEKFPAFRETGEIRDVELAFIRKDGSVLPVVINSTTVYDDQGKYVMSRSTMVDITERRKTEAALRDSRDKLSAANAALEKASRLKDEFLASMSHELRTPLTGILGLAEVLQLQTLGPLNEKQLKSVKNIESSGRHLLELINDILDLSKIEAGKLDIQFETCLVADICQASLQLVKGMAHQKKQTVSFSMNPVSLTLYADGRRLKQMLVNLLSNAVKFTPVGGKLGLEVQADVVEHTVLFCVWDKGIGIEPAELERLFQPFVQLDSSLARQHTGTGLGLSLVQRMAELHGGGVRAESVPNEGSRFSVILPWLVPPPSPLDMIQPGPAALQNAPIIENNVGAAAPLVMLADDNEVLLDMLTDFLKSAGYRVAATRSGLELLECVAKLHPDIMLLDIQMPGVDGLETMRRLRAHSDPRVAAAPLIAITALAMAGDRERCLQAGADEYMSKPIPMMRLAEQIKLLLKRQGGSKEENRCPQCRKS